jgi:hypothetical protein
MKDCLKCYLAFPALFICNQASDKSYPTNMLRIFTGNETMYLTIEVYCGILIVEVKFEPETTMVLIIVFAGK